MENNNHGNRLIFVGGTPRSGTTLVQNILDTHDDILGGPEFLHIPDIIGLRKKMHTSVRRQWISLICSNDDIDLRTRDMIEGFLLTFADRHNAKLLSEKSPENVLVFSELAELFPAATFLHVVRDPRAVVASLLQVAERARKKKQAPAAYAENISAAIDFIHQCIETGFEAEKNYPERIMTIVYEDLVREPEEVTKNICQFLNIDWHPSLCKPGETSHVGEQAITINSNEVWYDKETYNSNPNPKSLEKWRLSLTPLQQHAVANAFSTNQNLKNLGYDFSTQELNLKYKLIGAFFAQLKGTKMLFSRFAKRISRAFSKLSK